MMPFNRVKLKTFCKKEGVVRKNASKYLRRYVEKGVTLQAKLMAEVAKKKHPEKWARARQYKIERERGKRDERSTSGRL
jgi:hypothetical protein